MEAAEQRFPEAIERLKKDRSFIPSGESILDPWDVFLVVDDEDLVFANTLDMMADFWDPVDGCWMEYTEAVEEWWDEVGQMINRDGWR